MERVQAADDRFLTAPAEAAAGLRAFPALLVHPAACPALQVRPASPADLAWAYGLAISRAATQCGPPATRSAPRWRRRRNRTRRKGSLRRTSFSREGAGNSDAEP